MRISDWSSDVCSSDLHPDAADEHALLVERQSARIGGETERRAFGTDQRRGARRAETCRQVAARQLAELHPEQRARSEEHTSELQSLMRISYAVFGLKKKKQNNRHDENS